MYFIDEELQKKSREELIELALRMKQEFGEVIANSAELIADRDEAQARLELAYEDLKSQSKLALMGELSAGIIHEINNPLTIILGQCQITREGGQDSLNAEQFLKVLEKIERNGQRIHKIIQSMKSFSRKTSHDEKAAISVQALINESIELCGARLKPVGVEIRRNVAGQSPTIFGHASQFQQVVINLINNACDALESLPLEQRWIEFSFDIFADGIRLRLKDGEGGFLRMFEPSFLSPFLRPNPLAKERDLA